MRFDDLFVLIGLTQQLRKISNPSLKLSDNSTVSPAPSARNLGFIIG